MWGYGGGGAGGVQITDEVQFFANLPDPTLNPSEYWIVRESSGLWIVNRKEKGMYHSDGVSWTRLGEWQQAFSDANFEIYNSGDNSKKYKASLAHLPTSTTVLLETKKEHLITVAKSGGDFTNVKDAMDSITDSSETNRYTVQVSPGIYSENNPIQGKTYVTVKSVGLHSARIVAGNSDQDLFVTVNLFYLLGFSFVGVSGAGKYAVNCSSVGEVIVKDCVFADCQNGILLNNANVFVNLINCAVFTPAGSVDIAVHVLAGSITISLLKVIVDSDITTLLEGDGSTAVINLNNVTSLSANLTTAFKFLNGCQVNGAVATIENSYDGMIIYGNNTTVKFDVLKIANCQNNGFTVPNIGTGIRLDMFATTVTLCLNLNFEVLNPNSKTSGNGFTELNNAFIVPGAEFYVYLLDITEGDEGLTILGELHVGTPTIPTESAFGGGDSYTAGMLVYTETDLGVFVDVSTAARSASGSTFTFPGVIADNAIYVASSLFDESGVLDHFGIKSLINTAAVKGSGSIVAEYWNGSAWVEVACMEVDASGQYFPHANNYFEHVDDHHIRYNSELAVDTWTKNDPISPSLGTDYFWIRYRIDSTITTAPIFEQFKLHTNRTEINPDGWEEYFGKARPIGQLGLNFSSARPFEGNMQSQTVYINEDVGVGFTQNRFTLSGDKTGIAGFLPFDFDTSSPLKLQWSGRSSASQTIEWTIRVDWVTDNGSDLYYTSEPALLPGRKVVIVSKAITVNQVSMFEASIDVKEMLSRRDGGFGDEIWISIQPSTLSGTFDLVSSQATYTKWCQGGHI